MNFNMILFIIMLARVTKVEMIKSLEMNSSSSKNYYKKCGIKDLFSNLPETFPITKPSCYWFMYSDLIFYEYLNSSKNYSNCRKFIKDRCGLEKNRCCFLVEQTRRKHKGLREILLRRFKRQL